MRRESMFQPSIVITGATGLLGRACLPHLIARHGAENILALVRPGRDTRTLDELSVRSLEADLCAADLGLPLSVLCLLAGSIRCIIHAAADIRFRISLAESRSVNVNATQNLLRFAARCSRLDRFAHTSTVYVWGGKPGCMPEEPARPGSFFNRYQRTKFEAEQVTQAAMDSVPASIYRFSTMIYDGSAKRVDQFNYFHQLLRLAAINALPAIPALPSAKVDVIASDWAARVFDFALAEHWEAHQIFHICAGPTNALTIGELFETTFDLLHLSQSKPKIVTQHEFNTDAARILSTPSRRHMWQSLMQFLPHMNLDQTFDRERLNGAIRGRSDLAPANSRSLFTDTLAYCIESNWNQVSSAQLATTT